MARTDRLSSKTVAVLTLIAEGHSYSQIVEGHPDITYRDIFEAAEETLRLNESETDYHRRLAAIRQKFPKAYEKWTEDDDALLRKLRSEGEGIAQLAAHFQRQPSAIRSRLDKIGLK